MSAQNTASIQTLLEAEKEAQQIVEKARQYRTQKLKDARSEAQKEIEAYKATKDKEFKEIEATNNSGNNDAEAEAQKAVESELASIKKSQEEGKKVLVDNLLAALVKVEPEMRKVIRIFRHRR